MSPRVQGWRKTIWGQKALTCHLVTRPTFGSAAISPKERLSAGHKFTFTRGSASSVSAGPRGIPPSGPRRGRGRTLRPSRGSGAPGDPSGSPGSGPRRPRARLCCPLPAARIGRSGLSAPRLPGLEPGRGYLLGTSKTRQTAGRDCPSRLVFP